jgi:predicted ArsR family transcriptional regulator
LRGYSCPLASAATSHAEACQVIEAFLAKAVDARFTACCKREGRPRCCFEITPGRKRVA